MKQPGIVFSIFCSIYLIRTELTDRTGWRSLAVRLGSFLTGVFIPFTLTCLILLAAGVFKSFWFWTFTYAREYVSEVAPGDGWNVLWANFQVVVGPSIFIWIIAALGVVGFLWQQNRKHVFFLCSLLFFSLLGVCPGFYFRRHYFILMLPIVSLLAGMAVHFAKESLGSITRALAVIPALLFFAAFGFSIVRQRAFLFEFEPAVASRKVYSGHFFSEALKIADYVESHTATNARIAVLGSEPEIYFYAKRHSVTGYIYMYGLMEQQKYDVEMKQEMIHEIESARPEFVVYSRIPSSWWTGSPPQDSFSFFSWANNYLNTYYELVGVADMIGVGYTEYHWGDEAAEYQPHSPLTVEVFKRRM
jgi:hypothetical protein